MILKMKNDKHTSNLLNYEKISLEIVITKAVKKLLLFKKRFNETLVLMKPSQDLDIELMYKKIKSFFT